MSLSLNDRAAVLAAGMVADREALRIGAERLDDGVELIDCGAQAPGGLAAGLRFAEICMGGLGSVTLTPLPLGDRLVAGLSVATDHPAAACLASQYAGWKLEADGFFAMASGPARALVRAEPIFEELRWQERSDRAVLCLEARQVPPAAVRAKVAARAGVRLERLTLLLAPTASTTGSVQVAARVVETALHKLHELGFDPHRVLGATGSVPLPPIAADDGAAIGRTNDAVLYGGTVQLLLDAGDDELEALAPRLPASASSDHGEPFGTVLKRANWDFYAIDPLLFSPAAVALTSSASGRTHFAGAIAPEVLERSFWG